MRRSNCLIILLTGITFLVISSCNKDDEPEPQNEGKNINETGTFIDSRDGHEYKWVKLGEQIWMAENLAFLPNVSRPSRGSVTESYFYVYDYTGTSVSAAKATVNYNTYGVLYNWTAAKETCPNGWHLPSDDEWKQLEIYLGMAQSEVNSTEWRGTNEGSKLAGYANLWNNELLTNDPSFGNSGFSAIPGGLVFYQKFSSIKEYNGYWVASETDSLYAWIRELGYYNEYTPEDKRNGIRRNAYGLKSDALSVRCVKD
ncbi:MAG: fibrobacter succinogenes major paralogous domain-containing protein [Bacteroidota bacterium]